MGKVKIKKGTRLLVVGSYQFPMGKVKQREIYEDYLWRKVSIPYGKGKANTKKRKCPFAVKYQFPMGKVKAKELPSGKTVKMYQFPMGKVKLWTPLS